MKILFLNLGYESGIKGSLGEYIFGFHRFFFPSSRISERHSHYFFSQVIEKYEPDICAFVEISSTSQFALKLQKVFSFFDMSSKYAPGHLASYIFASYRSNAVYTKNNFPYEKKYFSHGNKRLVYMFHLEQERLLYIIHFSLRSSIRKKQFTELAQWIQNSGKKVIIAGDFNIFQGYSEIQELCVRCQLNILPKKASYPSFKPQKHLDLFLFSQGISLDVEVLSDVQISDHLPLLATIS